MEGKKKFSLTSAILSVICVVFAAKTAAPVTAIGSSQFFRWISLLTVSLLPYGLISSELRTTYIGERDAYDWVTKTYGYRWGARAFQRYWINYPLWLVLLAVMTPELLMMITGIKLSTPTMIIAELVFTWIVVWTSFCLASDSIWILDGAVVIKTVLAVLIGGLGSYVVSAKGVANESTLKSALPIFDLKSLSLTSIIISSLSGSEATCTFAGDMENSKKQVPQAIVAAGSVIAVIYTFSALGVGVAISTDQISTGSGMMDNFKLLTGSTESWLIMLVIFLSLLALFGNMISWSLGASNTACYVAENGDMPKFSEKRNKKNDVPIGVVLMNDTVAPMVIVLAPILPNQDLFWAFSSLNVALFLLSYILTFPVLYKLREIDPDTPRPFEVSGKPGSLKALVVLSTIMIITSLVFIVIPSDSSPAALSEKLPITIGAIIFILLGEVTIYVKKIRKGMKENGQADCRKYL